VANGPKRLVSGRDEIPELDLHAFIREPHERLRSGYQFFKGHPPIEHTGDMSWEQFVDFVLAGEKNPHWRPASETIALVGRPVTSHLFENIQSEYPLGTLEHRNSSAAMDVDMSYRVDELQQFYAADYELRKGLGA